MPKAITKTEMLAEMIANKVPLHKIRNMAYESGKRHAANHCIFGGRAISKWAGDQVEKVVAQIDDLIAK